jgi:hypothetical protein
MCYFKIERKAFNVYEFKDFKCDFWMKYYFNANT